MNDNHLGLKFGLIPAALFLFLFFVLPVTTVLSTSFYDKGFNFAQYQLIFSDSVYISVFYSTFVLCAQTALLCLVISYPLAFFLSRLPIFWYRTCLLIVAMPFFTSVIVRTFAWMVILGRNGLVNSSLQTVGVIDSPMDILYTRMGALIGMVYVMLPYSIFIFVTSMRGVDQQLLKASRSLGASPAQTLFRVFVPLTLPAVVAGTLVVFILSLGFFITPALMGGDDEITVAMFVERSIEFTGNIPLAAALSMVLLISTGLLLLLYRRISAVAISKAMG